MKKKTMCLICIVIMLLICITLYFKPIPLSDIANENNQIKIVLSDLGVRNGEACIDSVEYQDITVEQNSAIINLLEKFYYYRNFSTPFSDGSISDLGDKVMHIYVYADNSLVNRVFMTSSGKITINDKNYTCKKSRQLIEQIIEILEQAG